MLGRQVWRVLEITDDRVIVARRRRVGCPRMPFWHGDYPWRPYELGARVGAFRREVAERLQALPRALGRKSCATGERNVKPAGAANCWRGCARSMRWTRTRPGSWC